MVDKTLANPGIPNWATKFLSNNDLKMIEQAVQKAELETSGEIVPILVKSASSEASSRRILTLLAILLVMCFGPILHQFFDDEIRILAGEFLLALILVAFARYLPVPQVVSRFVLPACDQKKWVDLRAELEFHRLGISNTKDHTGILLFVSLTERRAVVLADKSIADKLPPETWSAVLETMLAGFKSKQAGRGFADAIFKCAEILKVHFPRQSDDVDELSNGLTIKE